MTTALLTEPRCMPGRSHLSSQRRWPPPEPASYRLGISVNDIVSWRLCGRKLVTRADHICYGCTIQLLLLYQYMVYYLIYADV